MRKTLLMLILAMAGIFASQAQVLKKHQMSAPAPSGVKASIEAGTNQMWWGYVNAEDEYGGLGVGASDTYYCAIFIPGTNAALLNKTISAVRFAMVSENAQSVSVWVSKTLPESISTKTVDELVPVDDVQVGINDVALSKAHKITSDGLYIGYTFRIPDVKDVNDAYPICITDGEPAINTLLLRTSKAITSWQNTTAYGRLYLQVLLNGSIAYQNAASPAGMEDVMLGINTEGTALMPVTNLGSEPITSIEYSVKAKTTTKASLEFASPIMFGNTSYVSIPLTGDETFGTSTRTITINKVNGKSNQAPTADKSVKITVTTLVRVVQRGIVMEEYTGTACGWCPRGLVGMEKLRAKYGNQFIGVAYHGYNGNYSDAMFIPSSAYTLSFSGAPSCHLQRAFGEIDPYYGTGSDIVSDCEAVISTPALADVQVVGEWNEDKTAINATATIEGVGGDGNYQIIYALIADGLTGEGSMWAQSNYYNGQTGLPQDMAFLTDAGSSYYPVFNDVCIATSLVNGVNKATEPGKIQLGQTVTNTYTIDMPAKDDNHAELYKALDYGKVAVVAMLIDKSSGIIENAMKFYMAPQTNPDDPELQAPEGWNSLIANGNLAGDDVSSFFSKEYPSTAIVGSAIFEGAGFNNSRGIIVKSQDKAAEAWDSQFFIRFNETLPEGTMLHVEFDYKADKEATIGTQAHGEPGAYKHWAAIGNVNFTPEWQHFSVNVTVEGAMADMQTIAFNLNDLAEANNYYFDNFGIWMQKPAPVEDWVNILANSEMEGTDVSAFFSKEAPSTEVVPSTIYDGAGVDGSRGIKVTSIAGAAQDWDSQFWIYMPCVLPEGTKYLVEFDYKADKDATADTQAHGEPGNYIFYSMIGSPSFTTEWQHYSKSGTISADQAGGGTFRSIAFNLSKDRANDVTFFFDNIKVFVEKSFADENLPAVAPVPDGKYYIMCASEEGDWFMSAGHNWGTRAIIDNTGLDLELVYDAPSGTYTIETGVYNNATNHFLGENLYMDSPAFGWKIEQTSSITFTISNGTQYIGIDHDFNLALSDTPAEWAFIDAAYLQQARFAEGMESLKAASMANGVDATFLLKDPQFNRNDHRWEAWTVSENCTNKNLGGGCDGNSGNGCAESWHSAFTISQLVEGAPAGFYALTAQGFYRQDDEMEEPAPYFFIGDATGLVPERTGTENSMTEAGNSFEQGLYTIEPIMFLLNEDGQFTVGITNGENLHQWVIWDNFKLTYFGMPADDPVLEAPEGWTSLISNGNLAGDDVANFFSKEAPAGEPSPSVIKLGAGKNGSRGINVQSADSPAQGWDTQFFIRFNEKLPEGTLLHVEFDYKADKNASASTQSHTEPGTYIHWAAIGTVSFTPEWQHYSADVTVSAEMNDMQTIAFNLAEETTATLYSFDNFGIWMQKPAPVEDWVNILANSEMEGTDVSAFFSKEAPSTEVVPSTIYDGAGVDGSRGIKVTSIAGAAQDWDSQFWIYMPCVLPEGTKYLVEFDYKADKDATADTQAHGEPGNYIFYSMIGSPSFTTEWQHYSKSGTISADQAGGGTFRSIAFNLSKDRANDVTFFFDNIKVFVEKSFADENLNTLPEADFADGKYILVNTASEKAWGAGNSWGTQASLVDHPEYVTLLKQPDGTYFMESQVSNGGESYYFNGDYMDQTPPLNLTIKTVSLIGENAVDGSPVYVYTISNGDNYFGWDGETTVLGKNLPADSENALWIIASIDDAVAGLAAATADDPMDATFLFLDPNFGRNNRNKSAWTGDDFGVGGDNSNMNAEKWGGNSQTFDISQTAEVPNGTYIVTWNGFYRYNNTEENTNDVAIAAHADGSEVINSFVYLNDEDYPLTSIADEDASEALNGALPFSQADASAAFGQGLYEQSAKVVVTDGQLTIGIKKTEHMGTDWTVWDNFRVSYLGEGDDNVLDLAIKHERQIGLGYTPTEATVDFTEAKAFLGVDEVTTSMLSFENPDGSLIPYADYMAANYDGWCNGEGAAENWGANTKICVKFFEAIPNGTFTFYDMNGADEVGATYSVKWRLTNDEKSVRYTVNVKFIEKPVIELNFADLNQLGNGVVVPFTSEVGSCYEGFNADVDVPAILGTLGAGSLDEVMIYAVQSDGSLDDNYKLGTTDGWRNAAGDWQGWGADAFFYVKANFAAESSQLYEVGGMDPVMNPAMNTPATYTATYAFVKKGTKDAVVLKVTLTYPDPDELIVNGTCEGEDAGCLLSKNGDGDGGFIWNPLAGAGIDGSTCAVVHATGTAANEWDAQFFIFAKDHVFTEGEKYKVTMWIKADNAAANSAQAHTTPGNYKHWRVISDGSPIQFTTEWTEFVYEGVIDADLDGIQTIAFNLNTDKTLENNYYFDNISWKIIREENGIETVETVNVEVEGIYNLRGQKVDKPTKKGVYIINGRKVVVK